VTHDVSLKTIDKGKGPMPGCLGVGFGGAVLLAHLLKMVFGRPRPSLSPVLVPMPTDFSLRETSFSEPGNPATILYGRSG
jgi:hypothetical protein